MYRMVNSLVSVLVAGGVLCSAVGAVQVQASVDTRSLSKSETFTFKIEARDSEDFPNIDISPLLDDFSIVSGPSQQTNIQWINGRMSSSRSLSWTLSPNRTGALTIPALEVRIGGERYRTTPISLEVGAGLAAASGDVFIMVEVDKDQAYVGEQVTVVYKLYTRVNLVLEKVDYPEGIGFWTEDLRVAQSINFRDTALEGVRYKLATLYKAALFPTRTGRLAVTPMVVTCKVEVPRKRPRRSIWDDPLFDSFLRETVQRVVRSDTTWIRVRSYPGEQPANFSGAVGQFELTSGLDTVAVRVNEAVTFRVELTGTGNLNQFNLPAVDFPPQMEVFPPTAIFEKEEFRDQLSGRMSWEYILIPRAAGRFRLPLIQLAYFNPADGRWHQARAPFQELLVAPGDTPLLGSARFTKEEVELLGQDIRYIKTAMPRWIDKGSQSLSVGIWISYFLAAVLAIAPRSLRLQRARRRAGIEDRRARIALRVALKGLRKPEPDPFRQVSQAVYNYLQAQFRLSTGNLDPKTVETLLQGRVAAAVLEELIQLLKTCDAGRFAPGAERAQTTLIDRARQILREVEREG